MTDPIAAAEKACGSLAGLAKALGESTQVVWNWKDRKAIPIHRCADVERVTGGAVKRWHMRPDDWHTIWPELVGTEGAPERAAA